MDAPAGGTEVLVLLHQIHEEGDGGRLEVDVAVQGEQVGVLGEHGLPVHGDGELHEPVAEEVVHVHALRPALLVPDEALVLEVDDHLGLAGEGVDEAAAVGGGDLLRRAETDGRLVDVGGGLVHAVDVGADELVDLHPVVADVRDLEGVVEEDVGWKRKDTILDDQRSSKFEDFLFAKRAFKN